MSNTFIDNMNYELTLDIVNNLDSIKYLLIVLVVVQIAKILLDLNKR